MFDLTQFSNDTTQKISTDNDTGLVNIPSNGIIGTAWETIKAAVRFKVTKFIFFALFVLVFMIVTGDFTKSKNLAEDASTKSANDDYFGLAQFFAKETGHKSTKLNIHPFYHTKGVRELENKYKIDFGRDIKFSKAMFYFIHNDQEYIALKGPARGAKNEKLKLELSSVFNKSANDYCEKYFDGFVPDEELREIIVDTIRGRKIKDELTEENDGGKKMFRCVIDPDVIEDYIENDRKN